MILSNCLTAVVLAASVALTGPVTEEDVVDGFVVEHVPACVGGQVSEFEFEFDDVTFRSQVWERGPDAAGAYAVDLTVKVLRGARLTDAAATAEFLATYHEQDPSSWTPFDHHGQPGHRRRGAVFWWDRPGVAVEVSLGGEQLDDSDLTAVALGIRAVPPGGEVGL